MKRIGNALLAVVSVVLSCAVAEGAIRLIDGLPLFTDYLPNTVDRDVSSAHLDEIARAAGVDRRWFFIDPPPLPNRGPVPAEWVRLAREIGEAPNWVGGAYRPAEQFKAWNSVWAEAPCQQPLLRQAPGRLYTYRPVDGTIYPTFRFVPNATTPLGLVTNQLGWRGPPVEFRRAQRTVRIVFVGASTTVNSHYYPYSYPELVGNWLNLWAAAKNLDVRFEALNAGREGMSSTDIEAIVRKEVLPMRPDLVVYYEGANQFDVRALLKTMPSAASPQPELPVAESGLSRWLRDASNKSAVARRLQAALGMVGNPGKGDEWAKPEYELLRPDRLDQRDPDITASDLPVNLSTIVTDLDRIRTTLGGIGAELAVSSFMWLAYEGMTVDPVRNKTLVDQLNIQLFPLRYRDIERASSFQNRVLAKFAASRSLPFIDVAGQLPRAPDLFTDGVHMSYGGIRLHGWIVMQGLVALAEKRLAAKTWPRPVVESELPADLFFTPTEIFFDCQKGKG